MTFSKPQQNKSFRLNSDNFQDLSQLNQQIQFKYLLCPTWIHLKSTNLLPIVNFYLRHWSGNLQWAVLSNWWSFCSWTGRGEGAAAPEAPRMAQKLAMQAIPGALQKYEEERGGRRAEVLPEGRERAPGSRGHKLQQRSRCHVFPSTRGNRQSTLGLRRQGISPETGSFSSCLGIFLKVSVPGRLTPVVPNYSLALRR